jgi:hypothetical protein
MPRSYCNFPRFRREPSSLLSRGSIEIVNLLAYPNHDRTALASPKPTRRMGAAAEDCSQNGVETCQPAVCQMPTSGDILTPVYLAFTLALELATAASPSSSTFRAHPIQNAGDHFRSRFEPAQSDKCHVSPPPSHRTIRIGNPVHATKRREIRVKCFLCDRT